jgi:glycosyltransferase involved in cell wall biosynthesis
VLSQDPRLEILVVDDGSPDGTAAIVQGIMER